MGKPAYSFRLYPLNTKLYYNCHIFKTLADLRSYADSAIGPNHKSNSKLIAMVIAKADIRNGRLQPFLGDILFCEKYLDVSTRTHELAHAMLRLIERKGWKYRIFAEPGEYDEAQAEYASEEEEAAAYAIGTMADQLEKNLKDLGLPLT